MFEPLCIIIIDFRLMLLPYFWLMLLPIAMILTDVIVTIEADVIALLCMFYSRCYCHILADVIANFVEDVKPHRKSTHTDLYLQWDSNHTITSKYGVVGTLHHRAKVICSSPELLHHEEKHLHQALTRCNYPEWALKRAKITSQTKKTKKTKNNTRDSSNSLTQKPYMVVPYYKGVSESLKKICGKHGVQVYFKGGHTIKSLLMNPKDQDPILKKSGVIYRYKCGRVDCDEEYIGESSRSFGERFKEHQKAPSPIHDHRNITGHQVTIENFNIVGREDQNLSRAIKEALYIRVNNPSLNKNIGKFHLPHIWDEVLFNTSELKLK